MRATGDGVSPKSRYVVAAVSILLCALFLADVLLGLPKSIVRPGINLIGILFLASMLVVSMREKRRWTTVLLIITILVFLIESVM